MSGLATAVYIRLLSQTQIIFSLSLKLQTSLSLPGSPFNIRRASRGSHQFTLRSSRPRFPAAPDTRPLVLNTLLDAQVGGRSQRKSILSKNACTSFNRTATLPFQDHLPYVDDSTAVTPMSEDNGAIIIPSYFLNLGTRHNSYTSHTSRISYTSHADLFKQPQVPTKESQLRSRSAKYSSSDYKFLSKEYVSGCGLSSYFTNMKSHAARAHSADSFQDVSCPEQEESVSSSKPKYQDVDVPQQQSLVDMKGNLVCERMFTRGQKDLLLNYDTNLSQMLWY